MELKLLNNSMIASKDENGQWIYKADQDMMLRVPFKKDQTLRKHYADMPRFKAIIETEAKLMKDYNNSLLESVKEMAHILHSFGH